MFQEVLSYKNHLFETYCTMVIRLNRMDGFETRPEYYTGWSLFSTLIDGSQLVMLKVNAAGIGFFFFAQLKLQWHKDEQMMLTLNTR
jgi:hypothetical protein